MKAIMFATIALAITMLSDTRSIAAAYYNSGGACRSLLTSSTSYSNVNGYSNNSPTPRDTACGFNWTNDIISGPAVSATVYYVDNNTDQTSAGSLYCYLNVDSGLGYVGPSVYSCANPGGCSMSTPGYSGANFLTLFPDPGLPQGWYLSGFSIYCYVPANVTSPSSISSYVLNS